MKRVFRFLILAVVLLLPAACATLASPEDRALTQRLGAALGPYAQTVTPLAVGGRVYLSGEVEQFSDLLNILDTVRAMPGVTSVMDDILVLTLAGGDKDSDGGDK